MEAYEGTPPWSCGLGPVVRVYRGFERSMVQGGYSMASSQTRTIPGGVLRALPGLIPEPLNLNPNVTPELL